MSESNNQVKDQVQDVLDQINSNTDAAFDLLTTISQQLEKLATLGIDETAVISKSGQKIGKDFVASSYDTANEAIKVAKSCIEGSLNLLKK